MGDKAKVWVRWRTDRRFLRRGPAWVWVGLLCLALVWPGGLVSASTGEEVINRKLNDQLVLDGEIKAFRISPDGGRLVFLADHERKERYELYSVPLAGGVSVKLNDPLISGGDVCDDFQISPDGSRVVYRADQDWGDRVEVYSVPLEGGEVVKLNAELTALGNVHAFQISPNSKRVVYLADQDTLYKRELYSVRLTGGSPTKLNRSMVADGEAYDDFQISSDSGRVVYRALQESDSNVELYSVPLTGPAGDGVKLNGELTGSQDVYSFQISPDDSQVVYRADQDSAYDIELYSVPLTGPTGAGVQLNDPLVSQGDVDLFQISSNSERVIYLADQEVNEKRELYSVPLAGGGVTKLNDTLAGGEVADDFQVSPNSKRVVYRAQQDTSGVEELYSVPLAGGGSTRLNDPLPFPNDVHAFQIAPNSKRVVYRAEQDEAGVEELYTVSLTGGSSSKLSSSLVDDGNVGAFQVSADSGWVVYLADQEADEVWELYRVLSDGGEAVKLNGPLLEEGDVYGDFQVSADSAWVVYRANQDRDWTAELYCAPLAGDSTGIRMNRRLAVVGDVSWDPQISPDSSRAVYRADQDTPGVVELYSVPLAGPASAGVRLNGSPVENGDVLRFQISPNSKRVVYLADQEWSGRDELYSVPLAGPASQGVKLNEPLSSGKVDGYQISPDSKHVVYRVDGGSLGPDALYSVPLGGGDSVQLNDSLVGGEILDFEISPDSSRVVYQADQEADSIWEIYSVPLGGPASAGVKLNDSLVGDGTVWTFQISPNSKRVVYLADQEIENVEEIYSVPLTGPASAGAKLNGTLVDKGSVNSFQISPNSKRVVYLADQDTDKVWELYSVPMDGGKAVKLNEPLPYISELGIGRVRDFQISPDSSRVVYRADQEIVAKEELYSVPLGGGQVVKLNGELVTYGNVGPYQISPDSSRVVYRADQEFDEWDELYSVPLAGPAGKGLKLNSPLIYDGAPNSISETNGAKISPDGQWVFYIAFQDSAWQQELYRVPLVGGTPTRLNGPLVVDEADVHPDFRIRPDSQGAVYWADQDTFEVWELYTSEVTSPPAAGWTDDFCGSKLNKGWSWIREDVTHWSLTERPCWLRIVLQEGGLYGTGNTTPNVLVRDAPEGDFVIETHLVFAPTENFQHAGLLVYRNDDNFLGLTRGYCGIAHQACVGNMIDYTYESKAGVAFPPAVQTRSPDEAYLRIRRQGGDYWGYVSQDGTIWRDVGFLGAFGGAGPAKVGLFVASGYQDTTEIPADFEYFRTSGAAQQVYLPLVVRGQ